MLRHVVGNNLFITAVKKNILAVGFRMVRQKQTCLRVGSMAVGRTRERRRQPKTPSWLCMATVEVNSRCLVYQVKSTTWAQQTAPPKSKKLQVTMCYLSVHSMFVCNCTIFSFLCVFFFSCSLFCVTEWSCCLSCFMQRLIVLVLFFERSTLLFFVCSVLIVLISCGKHGVRLGKIIWNSEQNLICVTVVSRRCDDTLTK